MLAIYPKPASIGRSYNKIVNPYRNTLNNIVDEPGFIGALREIKTLEKAILLSRIPLILNGSEGERALLSYSRDSVYS